MHADGACRLDTLRDLARKYGIQENGKPLPYDDPEQFKEHVALPRGACSLEDFLKVFRCLDRILGYIKLSYDLYDGPKKKEVIMKVIIYS